MADTAVPPEPPPLVAAPPPPVAPPPVPAVVTQPVAIPGPLHQPGPVVDWNGVMEQSGDDRTLVHQIATSFAGQVDQTVESIQRALNAEDRAALSVVALQLKVSCDYIAALPLKRSTVRLIATLQGPSPAAADIRACGEGVVTALRQVEGALNHPPMHIAPL